MNRRAVMAAFLLLATGCTVTSQDSDKVDMACVRGHDEWQAGYRDAVFVCDEYRPKATP